MNPLFEFGEPFFKVNISIVEKKYLIQMGWLPWDLLIIYMFPKKINPIDFILTFSQSPSSPPLHTNNLVI